MREEVGDRFTVVCATNCLGQNHANVNHLQKKELITTIIYNLFSCEDFQIAMKRDSYLFHKGRVLKPVTGRA